MGVCNLICSERFAKVCVRPSDFMSSSLTGKRKVKWCGKVDVTDLNFFITSLFSCAYNIKI